MSLLKWKTRTFSQFSNDRLFEVLKLRVDVFVVEQQCSYQELDEHDQHPEVRHLSGYDASGQLIAYSRLLPPGLRYPESNFGRFVVRADSRRQGIGHQLMKETLQGIFSCWGNISIKISAQDYVQVFYSQYGFIRVSDVYLEDEIPHVEMVKECC